MHSNKEHIQATLSFPIHGNKYVNVYPIQKKDAWAICDFVNSNEDRLQEYFPKTKSANLTPDLSNLFVDVMVKEFEQKKQYLFTLKINDSNTVIGLVYIKELDWNIKQGEFAYAIDYNYEGKGIISNVVKLLSEYAFDVLGLETLQIITHKTNISSVKVAENNKYIWVKTLSKSYAPPGKEALDMELYELYKDSHFKIQFTK